MVGFSSAAPDSWVETKGGWQYRYDAKEIERETDQGPVNEWQYEYVNVKVKERGVLIDTLITSRYSYGAQLGKLSLDRDGQEWQDYEAFRQLCYAIADAAFVE